MLKRIFCARFMSGKGLCRWNTAYRPPDWKKSRPGRRFVSRFNDRTGVVWVWFYPQSLNRKSRGLSYSLGPHFLSIRRCVDVFGGRIVYDFQREIRFSWWPSLMIVTSHDRKSRKLNLLLCCILALLLLHRLTKSYLSDRKSLASGSYDLASLNTCPIWLR